MAGDFDWMALLEAVLPAATELAIKLVKDATAGATTREEALARLRQLDDLLPQALTAMHAQLVANDAAEDARRAAERGDTTVEDTAAAPTPTVE